MKFKAGDKVRVKHFDKIPYYWDNSGKMNHLMGKVVDVIFMIPEYGATIYDDVNDKTWMLKKDDMEPVCNERIAIYHDGQKVIAEDKKTGKTGVARCNPIDKFDFYTGAKLAFERLTGEKKEKVKFAPGMAILCENKSQYDELMSILEVNGYKWKSGSALTEYTPSCVHDGVIIYPNADKSIGYRNRSESFNSKVNFSDVDFSECTQKIKVGDYVRVTRPDYSYCLYSKFFEEYADDIPVDVAARFTYGRNPEKDKRYKVLYNKKHPSHGNDLYVIENAAGAVYIIDVNGVEKW